MAGTGTELLLLAHHETPSQLIPLGLIAVALGTTVWLWLRPAPPILRLFQGIMALFVLSGLLGIVLHFRGNMEFQREMDPEISGSELFWEVMRAKAPPALAPGTMSELGLLGFLYAFKHPAGKSLARDNRNGGV